ncbi:TPA: hypothetical protein N0F65_003312 [Lagenidium giganteum]|uniref:EF-hand domain-containing protein n=1 Tax=Lagenidium giganteum TaxID=4803 RepID=A0AAV2ZEX4_9STRA|nr:TPA: hypothetical protein N0F65_003312 [Lagenidium giganteum]
MAAAALLQYQACLGIMVRLKVEDLTTLRRDFDRHGRGLSLNEFVSVMLDRVSWDVDNVVSFVQDLVELFAQVDVNGDGAMEWEEFTSAIIEGGMGTISDDTNWRDLRYEENPHFTDVLNRPTKRIQFLPEFRKLLLYENTRPVLEILDPSTLLPNDNLAPKDDSRNDDDGNGDDSATSALASDLLSHDPNNFFTPTLTLVNKFHPLCYIAGYRRDQDEVRSERSPVQVLKYLSKVDLLAVSAGDLKITFWSTMILTATSSSALETPSPVAIVHTPRPQRVIEWNPSNQLLFSISADLIITVWHVKREQRGHDSKGSCEVSLLTTLKKHTDLLQDLLVLNPETLLSCGMDSMIYVWDAESLQLKQARHAHRRGVRLLTKLSAHLFLSAGFEGEVFGWDISPIATTPVFRLWGHNAPVCCIQLIPVGHATHGTGERRPALRLEAGNAMLADQAITVDDDGWFKWWDLSNVLSTEGTDADAANSHCLQTFRIGSDKYPWRAHSLVVLHGGQIILAAGLHKLKLLQRVRLKPKVVASNVVLYNSVSFTLLTTTDKELRVWDAVSGALIRVYRPACTSEITCIDMDARQRKLVVGTQNGQLLVINYLNGALLKQWTPHQFQVSAIIYCKEDQTVLTASWDRSIRVYDDSASTNALLRCVTDAHDSDIRCLAYCYAMSLVASGSSDGTIKIWDYIYFQLEETCPMPVANEVDALEFVDPYPMLVSGHENGMICCWNLTPTQPCSLIVVLHPFDVPLGVDLAPDNVSCADTNSVPATVRTADAANEAATVDNEEGVKAVDTSRTNSPESGQTSARASARGGSSAAESGQASARSNANTSAHANSNVSASANPSATASTTTNDSDHVNSSASPTARTSASARATASARAIATARAIASARANVTPDPGLPHDHVSPAGGVSALQIFYDESGGEVIAGDIRKGRFIIVCANVSGDMAVVDISHVISQCHLLAFREESLPFNHHRSYNPRRRFLRHGRNAKRLNAPVKRRFGVQPHITESMAVVMARWRAHHGVVRCLRVVDEPLSIVSCSCDKHVMVWTLDGACLGSLATGAHLQSTLQPSVGWRWPIDVNSANQAKRAQAEAIWETMKAEKMRRLERKKRFAVQELRRQRQTSVGWPTTQANVRNTPELSRSTASPAASTTEAFRLDEHDEEGRDVKDRLFMQLQGGATWKQSAFQVARQKAWEKERVKFKERMARIVKKKTKQAVAASGNNKDEFKVDGTKSTQEEAERALAAELIKEVDDQKDPTVMPELENPMQELPFEDKDNWGVGSLNREKMMYGHFHHEQVRRNQKILSSKGAKLRRTESLKHVDLTPSTFLLERLGKSCVIHENEDVPLMATHTRKKKARGSGLSAGTRQTQSMPVLPPPEAEVDVAATSAETHTAATPAPRVKPALSLVQQHTMKDLFKQYDQMIQQQEEDEKQLYDTSGLLTRGFGRQGTIASDIGLVPTSDATVPVEAVDAPVPTPDSRHHQRKSYIMSQHKKLTKKASSRFNNTTVNGEPATPATLALMEKKHRIRSDQVLMRQDHFGPYPREDIINVFRTFQAIDKDHSGAITLTELMDGAGMFSGTHLKENIMGIFSSIDTDESGHIDLRELCGAVFHDAPDYVLEEILRYCTILDSAEKSKKARKKQLTPEAIEELKQLFRLYDVDHNGDIDVDELFEALQYNDKFYDGGNSSSRVISREDVARIISKYDVNTNHSLDINEFIELFRDEQ